MFQLHEVSTREEFDAVMELAWEAMQNPYRQEFHWLHPVHGYSEEDRAASFKKDADQKWQSTIKNPASHWFYVTDTPNGEPLGAVEWHVNTKNPFPNGPVKLECTWFPEGETRDFVTELINQLYYARMHWMNRPFIAINAMAVRPAMRGRGIGTFLMNWGMQKADELNLECWVEASDLGSDLYEKFGFRRLMTFTANMHKKNPSQTWTRLEHTFKPSVATLMWRPSLQQLNEVSSVSFWQVMAEHANPKSTTATNGIHSEKLV